MITAKVREAQRRAMLAKSTPETFWRRVGKCDNNKNDCWEWSGQTLRNGYGRITYRTKAYSCHRLAWILANGSIPSGMSVLHKCDNRLCCNPSHLFIGTAMDNWMDCVRKNRAACGEKAHKAKLTSYQVHRIRESTDQKITDLAAQYRVTKSTISKIVLRQTWKHIQ